MTNTESRVTLPENNADNKIRGSYILITRLDREAEIPVGRLSTNHFREGYYAYVGSAMGGLKSRLNHHLRTSLRPHWHIDYLLSEAAINDIITCKTEVRVECDIARALSYRFHTVPGFGSSDCRCRSHLFYSDEEMTAKVISIVGRLRIEPVLMSGFLATV